MVAPTFIPVRPPPSTPDHDVSSTTVMDDCRQRAQSRRGQATRESTTPTVRFPLAVLYNCRDLLHVQWLQHVDEPAAVAHETPGAGSQHPYIQDNQRV